MANESLAPVLLVSMPQMLDPNFSKTVVLLAEYGAHGAFGLVLNRRMDEPASAIVTADEPLNIHPGMYLSASPALVRRTLESEPNPATRMVVGYAGWGAGQLDVELAEGSWLLAPVESDLIFANVDSMWEAAIRRLGAEPSMLQGSSGVH
jgi:putative transcriptional regulator